MLKTLTKYDTSTTPYIATKDWNLSNVSNTDLVLSEDGNPVGVENVDFFFTGAIPNYNCNVAKEDQSNDLASYREGLKTTGLFYPDLDPINIDGTYKRMVYAQIKTMFYNNFRDPTQMWGLEKIDFDTSGTKKFLSDLFKLFLIPTEIMGLKMVEGSVQIIDNTLDNDYIITDDGLNNLFAGTNLFSKQQELGDFDNVFLTGSDINCNTYFDFTVPKNPYALTASQVGLSESVFLNWLDGPADGFVIQRSMNDSGSGLSDFSSTPAGVTSSFDNTVIYGDTYWYRVYAYNVWGTSSFSNTASVTVNSASLTLTSNLPNVCMNIPYDNFLTTSNGIAPYTYSIISGSLPSGFTFNTSSGEITGTSSVYYPPITTSFVAAITDSLQRTATSSINLISIFCGIIEPWDEYSLGQTSTYNGGGGWSTPWNIISPSIYFAIETWDEYSLNQNSSFNSGSGWNGPWYVDSLVRFVASESWDEYSLGQTGSYSGGFGLARSWTINTNSLYMIASESWNEYSLGQTSSYNGDIGWITQWAIMSNSLSLISSESWNEYSLGQTSSYNGDIGWITQWAIMSNSLSLISSESWNEYSLGQTTTFNGGNGWTKQWTDANGDI